MAPSGFLRHCFISTCSFCFSPTPGQPAAASVPPEPRLYEKAAAVELRVRTERANGKHISAVILHGCAGAASHSVFFFFIFPLFVVVWLTNWLLPVPLKRKEIITPYLTALYLASAFNQKSRRTVFVIRLARRRRKRKDVQHTTSLAVRLCWEVSVCDFHQIRPCRFRDVAALLWFPSALVGRRLLSLFCTDALRLRGRRRRQGAVHRA